MALAPSEILAARLGGVRGHVEAAGLDALIVTHLPNVFYLTNFTGTSAIVVLTADALYFITDFRYLAAVQAGLDTRIGCPGATLVAVDRSYDETLAGLLKDRGFARVGFEAERMTVARFNWLTAALGGDANAASPGTARSGAAPVLAPTERVIERERLRKDAHEIETLRTAAARLSEMAPAFLASLSAGETERQVAARLDWTIRQGGFDRPAFDTIVASGPNAGLPHARPTNRRLEAGDLVVLDFGGVHDGYCVDLTRTVSIGPPGPEARRIHQAVAEAQAAAIRAVRPGVAASAIDREARDTLGRHGLGEAFGHGTGHGLGIEVHEEPRITRRPPHDEVIDAGMVFTIEPGAYLPGFGGVRIEDDVLVREDGCEVLTEVPRELMAAGGSRDGGHEPR